MPKKKNVRRSKENKKKAPPSKKAAPRKKPARKKRPAAKKSPAAHATFVETVEVDVVNGAPEAEEPERIHEEVDDDFPHDLGGSE
jgi:hypothetical protein